MGEVLLERLGEVEMCGIDRLRLVLYDMEMRGVSCIAFGGEVSRSCVVQHRNA